MDIGDFLGACASGDTETVRRLARDLDPDSGRDVLEQGLYAARMSATTEAVEFLQPIVDALRAAASESDTWTDEEADFIAACAEGDPERLADLVKRFVTGRLACAAPVGLGNAGLRAADASGHVDLVRSLIGRAITAINSVAEARVMLSDGESEVDHEMLAEKLTAAEGSARSIGSSFDDVLQEVLGYWALHLRATGHLSEALSMHDEEVAICRRLDDRSSLQVALWNRARTRFYLHAATPDKCHLSEALIDLAEQESICRELGKRGDLADALSQQAFFRLATGDDGHSFLKEACSKALEALGIYQSLGNAEGMAESHGILAGLLPHLGDYEQAIVHFEQSARIFEELGNSERAQQAQRNIEQVRELASRMATGRHGGAAAEEPSSSQSSAPGVPVAAGSTRSSAKSTPKASAPFAAQLKALASQDEDARREAARTLADAGAAALPALLQGLAVRSRESRALCSQMLMEYARLGESFVSGSETVTALAARLDDPDVRPRRLSGVALGFIGTDEAMGYLREASAAKDEMTRAFALAGLYAAGDEGAHAQLLEMVADASADGRWAAVASLHLVGKPGTDTEALKSALSDRSKYVRETAEVAISNLEPRGEHPRLVISDGVLVSYEGDDQEVTIPDSVTSIGDSAFSNCSSLVSVTIPDSVTSIGDGAFDQCSSLASVTIPDSVTAIGNGVFCGCKSLETITIPDSVTSIGRVAFGGCKSLASVTIPDSVTSIGNHAFNKCVSLVSVTIPDSVTSIGDGAFMECSSLVSVTFYSDVLIGKGAFLECASLASVSMPALDEQIATYRRREEWYLLQVALGDRASVHIHLFAETQNESLLTEAVVYLAEREAICREMGIADGLADALIGQGTHVPSARHGDQPFIEELRTKALEALGIYERVGDTAAMAEAHRVLAGLLVFLRDYAQALAHNERSAELFDEVGDTEKAHWLRTIGSENIRESQGLESGSPTPQGFVPDGAPVQEEQTPKRDRAAPPQAPKKSKKDSATPYTAELKALASRDEEARQRAGQALADAGEAALPALLEGLSARSRDCRIWCSGLLKEHARLGAPFVRDSQVVEALAARLDDPDWEARRYRAAALGYIGTPDALAHLREVRDSEDEVTRAAALAGLYAAGDEEAHAQLLEMVADASADGRWAAVMSLDLVSKPGVDLKVLKSALSDRSKYVREAAESAISNLESRGEQDTDDAVHHARASEGRSRPVETAAEALVELLSATSPFNTANAQERLRALTHFASFGVKAVDALEEFFVDPYRKYGISEDQLRHIAWAFARIDEAGSAQRILEFAMGMHPEFIVQALRAIARPGVAHTVDKLVLVKLGSLLGDISEEEPLYNDSLFALAMLFDNQDESASKEDSDWASFLLGHFETAMRWERRIHLEREYGILGAELDPLYQSVERVLRSMKGPYYFRPSEVRASRLAARGIDAEGLVLTEEQVSRVRLGDVVTTVLEYEYEHGLHVSHVRVRVEEEPRETSDGRLFRGTVQSVEPWAGPYELREGERVWFLGAHIHGSGE